MHFVHLPNDTYKHQGQRQRLVKTIAQQGISDENVLAAINTVPRHFFFQKAFWHRAYENSAFPIDAGQTISQPYTVAYQTSLLQIQKGNKVLEIGTGSGYQAAVLAAMGARVISIERQERLYYATKALLTAMELHPVPIQLLFGDGYKGAPAYADFDKILITAAAPEIPQTLLQQLKIGGILVVPVGNTQSGQDMYSIQKTAEDEYTTEIGKKFRFVPMLPGKIQDKDI